MTQDLLAGFRVGFWKVHPLRGEIRGRNGESIHLEPKVMDVLVCLASHAGDLVSRDELIKSVWGGADVSDEAVTRAVGKVRRALNDDFHHP